MNPTKIYYVEDDRDDADLLTDAFAGVGYGVTVFPNPVELFHVLHADELLPTLIILDINLPVMDGLEALQLLKAEPKFKRIPVALLSTNPASAHGKVDERQLVFLKPPEYHEYEQIVTRLLALSQSNTSM